MTLRGGGRDNTVIRGIGAERKTVAVVALHTRSALRSVTIEGAVGKGEGDGLVLIARTDKRSSSHVTIADCRLRAWEDDLDLRRPRYHTAVLFGAAPHLKLLRNDIYGAVGFDLGFLYRGEIIGNTFHGGTAHDVCTIIGKAYHCLIDSNLFTDDPGRVGFYLLYQCYVRYNQVHAAFRGTWANATETYLIHGSSSPRRARGKATAGGADTLTDANAKWGRGGLRGCTVLLIAGRGFGQYRRIVECTADTMTVSPAWRVVPDETTEYVAATYHVETAFFANLNRTAGGMTFWMDSIGNVVDHQRDVYSSGISIVGGDDTGPAPPGAASRKSGDFFPCYYNTVQSSWMDGAAVSLSGGATTGDRMSGPPLFGNMIVGNWIRAPHLSRSGHPISRLSAGGVQVGRRLGRNPRQLERLRVAISHSLVAGNDLAMTDIGVAVSAAARKTFVLGNDFHRVRHPVLDWGARTVARGNLDLVVDESGLKRTRLPDTASDRELRRTPDPAARELDEQPDTRKTDAEDLIREWLESE